MSGSFLSSLFRGTTRAYDAALARLLALATDQANYDSESPDDLQALVQIERLFLKLRYLAAGVAALLLPFLGVDRIGHMYVIIGFFLLDNLFRSRVVIPHHPEWFRGGYLPMILELTALGAAVAVTGGTNSIFGVVYYPLIAIHSLRFGRLQLFFGPVTATISYTIATIIAGGTLASEAATIAFRAFWFGMLSFGLSLVVERGRLAEARLAAELRRIRALLRAAHAPASSLTVNGVLSAVLEQARALTESDVAAVRVIAARDGPDVRACQPDGEASAQSLGPLIDADSSTLVRLLASAGPVKVDSLGEGAADEELVTAGITSLCAAAIHGTDRPLGVVVVGSRIADGLTSTHYEALTAFLERATLAIQNARLYEKLQEQVEELRAMHERVVRTERLAAIGEVAAKVAHEVNNPLTSIQLYNSLLLEEHVDFEEQRRVASNALEQVERAKRVVRDILDYSRPSVPQLEIGSLNDAVEQALPLVEHAAHSGGVTIETHLGAHLPMVRLDKGQIAQVVTNLTINAVHAMQDGGRVMIETGVHEGELFARFEDNGVGIAQEHLDHIFEPFFSTRPAGQGTGLGLAVCRSVVTHHSGRITVESQPGRGSSFTVWLPPALVEEGAVANSGAK